MSTELTATEALEAFRGFLVLALAGLVDGTEGVMYAAQKVGDAGRPALPYLTVQWMRSRALSSVPYSRVGDEVDPEAESGLTHEHIIQQVREGTVNVLAYGDVGPELLESLPLRKLQLDEQKYLNDQRIAIRPMADILDTKEFRDTTWESSALQEWAVIYTVEQISRIGTITTVTTNVTMLGPDE